MSGNVKRFFWGLATSGLKDAIWFYKLLGMNEFAGKLEQKRTQYIEAQANNEDVPGVKVVKLFIYLLLILGIVFILLKFKQIKK